VYGSDYFGLDYNQRAYRWVEANYEPVGQFGEFVRGPDKPFAMLVYRRRSSFMLPDAAVKPREPAKSH
jgi:hypothetical protein